MSERWEPVLEGFYEASSLGRVRRLAQPRAGRLLSQSMNGTGYPKVSVCVRGKESTIAVHRLVAAAFIGECPSGHQVNHIDGNKTNNCQSNLEYVTPAWNTAHAVRLGLWPIGDRNGRSTKPERSARGERVNTARLNEAQVVSMRVKWSMGATLPELMAEFGLSKSGTWMVCTRKNWRHVA